MTGKHLIRLMVIMILLYPADALFASSDSAPGGSGSQTTSVIAGLEKTWGIQIIGIRWSAGGYMLDFRYRVLDPKKAESLFDRKTDPCLIDQASGEEFKVPDLPKVGPLKSSNMPQADRVYGMFFGNPGRYVQRGSRVTVVIGEFRAENLVVR